MISDDQSSQDFAAAVERHRSALQAHCYRMVGSLTDAEDLAQEAIVRAWRRRTTFAGRSSLRGWLYSIATNVCIDHLARRPKRDLPAEYRKAIEPGMREPSAAELIWLDPCPEALIESLASPDPDPEAVVTARETLELAYLAAIQHLRPRRRAVLILRDALGWSARETASALEMSVAAVNTALPRARATMREHLPAARMDWPAGAAINAAERELLRRYMEAHERADVDELARLVADDVRLAVPPLPEIHEGREHFLASVRRSAVPGRFRYLPTMANGQLAAASYVHQPDGSYRPLAIDVLRMASQRVAAVTVFLRPDLFPVFALPESLSPPAIVR
jgi:RNA polymerase sigma-70 factor, ECF subfamily